MKNEIRFIRSKAFTFVLTLISCTTFYMLHATFISAKNMDSTQFRIQNSNVNIGAKDISSSNYSMSTTLGQTAAAEFSSNGYVIRSGFQNVQSNIPFTFSLSKSTLTLGALTPNNPQTTNLDLSVSYGSSGGYQVATQAQGPMRTFDGSKIIAFTSCNGGNETCTPVKAALWTSNNKYGFGYSISGQSVAPDFKNNRYFRPFPDESRGQNAAVIIASDTVTQKSDATVTVKVNIPSTQTTGIYTTVINFIATPGF